MELSDKIILLFLADQEKCSNKKQICEFTSLNANTVHASIKRLIQKNLVTLHPSPMRSSCRIEINPVGREIAPFVKIIFSHEKRIYKIIKANNSLEPKKLRPILN